MILRLRLEILSGREGVLFSFFEKAKGMHFYYFSLYENFIFLAHALKVSPSEYPGFTLRSLICLAIQLGHRLCLLFFTYCAIENSSLGHEESANLSPVYCIFVNSYLWVTPLYSCEFIHALKRFLRNYITRHTGVKEEGKGLEERDRAWLLRTAFLPQWSHQ